MTDPAPAPYVHIVQAKPDNLQWFQEHISELEAQGYEPIGGPAFGQTERGGRRFDVWLQVMRIPRNKRKHSRTKR